MADEAVEVVWVCGDLQPVDVDVTVLPRSPQEPSTVPSESHRLDLYIEQAQTTQPVPDPIQLRGVGGATL